ncbi:MAG TPA: HAD-IIA family hydrolase [Thermoleophilaceae bacterium]|nr:HAD-IIA family hydrolase [Thermoleophilaceae bacterium]
MTALSPLLQSYDQVILDLDGCVRVGDTAVPGSPEAIAALRGAGKRVAFATNNSLHSGEEQVQSLWGIGVQASLADVVTVGGALQHLLAETRTGRGAFVIGTAVLHRHVTDAGLSVLNGTPRAAEAEVVVVGGTDRFDYALLRDAALAARHCGDLLATARDPTLPMPDGPWPGTGSLLAAVEVASGQTAGIVGKPEAQLMLAAMDRLGEGRTLVVGDRLDSDVAAAGAAGLDAALVLSGPDTGEAAEDDPQPVATAATLAELVGVSAS